MVSNRFFNHTNFLTVSILALVVAIIFMGAHFISLKSAQLSAKNSIQTSINELSLRSIKSTDNIAMLGKSLNAKLQSPHHPNDWLYFLAAPDRSPIAGNLTEWPENAQPYNGWHQFDCSETNIMTGPCYARVTPIYVENAKKPYNLLVGKSIPAVPSIFRHVWPIFFGLSLISIVSGIFIFQAQQSNKPKN